MSHILFVHAHPDDELLATGLAVVKNARLGAEVHVLTCTLGDEGEVIPAALAHLEGTDDLAPHRRGELRRAMSAAGVKHRVLGEPDELTADAARATYRDSGMAGSAAAAHPRALVNADLDEAAAGVRDVIESVRADIVVTYDQHGGYEHPDHIRTHEIACRAVAGLPQGRQPVVLAQVTPRSWAVEDRELVRTLAAGSSLTLLAANEPYPAGVVDDRLVTLCVLADDEDLALRDAALRQHETQVTVCDRYYALSNDIAARLAVREGYVPLDPATGEFAPDADVTALRGTAWIARSHADNATPTTADTTGDRA